MIFHDNAFNLLYSCIVNKHEKTFFKYKYRFSFHYQCITIFLHLTIVKIKPRVEKYHKPLIEGQSVFSKTKLSKIFLTCLFPLLTTVKRKLGGNSHAEI